LIGFFVPRLSLRREGVAELPSNYSNDLSPKKSRVVGADRLTITVSKNHISYQFSAASNEENLARKKLTAFFLRTANSLSFTFVALTIDICIFAYVA